MYNSNERVRRAIDAIAAGEFDQEDRGLFRQVRDWLTTDGDPYMLLADVTSYAEAQRRVEALWRDPVAWTRAAILNVANMGSFSSDRSVAEYARSIWDVEPVPVEAPPASTR